jgi:hypothetical protein
MDVQRGCFGRAGFNVPRVVYDFALGEVGAADGSSRSSHLVISPSGISAPYARSYHYQRFGKELARSHLCLASSFGYSGASLSLLFFEQSIPTYADSLI